MHEDIFFTQRLSMVGDIEQGGVVIFFQPHENVYYSGQQKAGIVYGVVVGVYDLLQVTFAKTGGYLLKYRGP
jgi:hypothetical protein